ncbi:DUF2911 domain-containing protein [Aquimarina sp. 2304DJ70-9]|uniref:DUF2911 domain-containing protein n=1 Tax=Aquimarina penaris TaxID=3231044 RepID=UPI00346253DD
MKKLVILSLIVVAFLTAPPVIAQKFTGLQKSPTDIAYAKKGWKDKPTIKVIYSRPQKNGRVIFGSLEKYGKVWRTGADESTEIELFQDYKFGSNTIKAGTYSLFTIPGEKEWTVILNSDLNSWGAFSYEESKDVARIKVPVKKSKNAIEVFSIVFEAADQGYHMFLGWDDTIVEVPFYN